MANREDKATIPCPALAPVPDVAETKDPRESITWPNGWVDANGVAVRVSLRSTGAPFERKVGGCWFESTDMGPLPHKRRS